MIPAAITPRYLSRRKRKEGRKERKKERKKEKVLIRDTLVFPLRSLRCALDDKKLKLVRASSSRLFGMHKRKKEKKKEKERKNGKERKREDPAIKGAIKKKSIGPGEINARRNFRAYTFSHSRPFAPFATHAQQHTKPVLRILRLLLVAGWGEAGEEGEPPAVPETSLGDLSSFINSFCCNGILGARARCSINRTRGRGENGTKVGRHAYTRGGRK
jgi:hypothetical protein